uniref:PiggyBac transposable element-derived protein domain-containing protein n=1 Tax=Amphimedon queenslandica TaxID=400682 RepID=A0A1X7U7F9_AMPQE
MARQYIVEEALDLVMDDDSHEVFCLDSYDELGFEDNVDDCILETDATIDDTVVTTSDLEAGTEPATTSPSPSPAGDMESSIPSTPAATVTDNKWTDLLEPVNVAEFNEPVGPAVPVHSSPLKVFQLFFTSVMMDFIVTETNSYASLCMGKRSFRNGRE